MKFVLTSALLASTALASVVPRAGQKVDYNGYKALRVTLPEGAESVRAQIEDLVAHILSPGKKDLDVVVAPQDIAALNALVTDSIVINEDVGAALKEEGPVQTYAGMATSIELFDVLIYRSTIRVMVYVVSPICRPSPVPARSPSRIHQQLGNLHSGHISPGPNFDRHSDLGCRRTRLTACRYHPRKCARPGVDHQYDH